MILLIRVQHLKMKQGIYCFANIPPLRAISIDFKYQRGGFSEENAKVDQFTSSDQRMWNLSICH